jgi:lipid-binding SYLF domain-containing protein
MKEMILGLALLGFVSSALAVDRAELDGRIRTLTHQFEALQQQPDERVPADVLRRAKGIILLNRTKAGFMFAVQSGGGVAMVKEKSGDWSPAAFIRSNGGSFGFQGGGEQDFCVMLLMNASATRRLTDSTIHFANEARGTAGNNSAGAEKNFDSSHQSVLVYAERSGFYGGVAFKGGTLSADRNANELYYDKFVTLKDILFDHKVEPTDASIGLADKIKAYSKK